ncbi:ATP-binding protein [Aliikangiella sp. IMCC44632]
MFLKKLIMVNWGNLPNGEFEFGPVNLFSGGNGSGKTTAADIIQTIMTAAHENLFQYNPGQDETTQKGKGGKKVRTLASYILGCDDGSYARINPTDGYMAASFYPSAGESGEPFTAMLAVRAFLENAGNNRLPRQDELVFYILTQQQNRGLQLADLQPNNQVLTLDNLNLTLTQIFGQSCVEKYETKRAYLRRLYGALRGKKDAVSEVEALNAAKAFSRFMAYKPVQSINRFVADEILEKKDLGEAVRSISSQLKTIHSMEADASKIRDSVELLQNASQLSQNYIEGWRDIQVSRYTLAKSEYLTRQSAYVAAKDKQLILKNQEQEVEQQIEINSARVSQLHEQRVALEAQRMGIESLQKKDELEKQRNQQNKMLSQIGVKLLQQNQDLEHATMATKQIVSLLQSPQLQNELPFIANLNCLAQAKRIVKQDPANALDVHGLLSSDILNDIQGVESQLDNLRQVEANYNQWVAFWIEQQSEQKTLVTQVANCLDRTENQYRNIEKERQQVERKIEKLQQAKAIYPDYVEKAIEAIKRDYPQADPRVLCDHVEVLDSQWQTAIEGYLGGSRFSILVDEAFEAQAIRAVRNLPGRASRARVIQGSKAHKDADRVNLESDSICNLLKFSHAVAKSYVMASYASVVRVADEQALRSTRRGLTVDCLASGNYAMFRCDISESDLVFGQEARERALIGWQQELDKLTEQWNQVNSTMLELKQLAEQIAKLKPMQMSEALSHALECRRELQKIESLIAQIDVSDHQDLEDKLVQLAQEETSRQEQNTQLVEERGKLKNKLETLVKSYKQLSAEQEATLKVVEKSEDGLQKILAIWPDFSLEAHLNQADIAAQSLDKALQEKLAQEQESLLYQYEKRLDDAIKRHNQLCQPGDSLVYESFNESLDLAIFKRIVKLQQQVDNIFNRLKNNILLEKHQQLKQLKASFNHTFVSNLCHSIHQAINDGKRQIELLNKELENHRFGDDRETFRFDYRWVPEFKEYARFFEEVIKNPDLSEGQTLFEANLKQSSVQIRDRLMNMLLDEDSDKALRELARIADYRNYREYEIYKEVEGKPPIALSEYGTGSGGQLETPAYIIRAAAITSAFKFSEGRCHLRTVLVDEAFSKMDETRSREVINYLTESLGLQLVFIMPTSKCGPFMDLISNEFVFAKCPSETKRGELNTRVLVDRKVCNQEKIKALWASHKRTVYRQAELDFLAELDALNNSDSETQDVEAIVD